MEMVEKGENIVIDKVINDLETAKRILAYPNPLGVSRRIKMEKAITEAIELLNKNKKEEIDHGTETT